MPAYVSYTVSGPIGSSVAGDSPTRGATFGKKGKGIWPSRSVDKKETTVKVRKDIAQALSEGRRRLPERFWGDGQNNFMMEHL